MQDDWAWPSLNSVLKQKQKLQHQSLYKCRLTWIQLDGLTRWSSIETEVWKWDDDDDLTETFDLIKTSLHTHSLGIVAKISQALPAREPSIYPQSEACLAATSNRRQEKICISGFDSKATATPT